MTIADMIIYLRQQLMTLRSENNRQAVAELLATFKMLTKAAYKNGDQELVRLLVDLTDSTRDLYMGKPLNGRLPTEEVIRAIAGKQVAAFASPSPAPVFIDESPEEPHDDTQPLDPSVIEAAIQEAEEEQKRSKRESVDDIMARLKQVARRNWYDHSMIRDGDEQQMRAYTTVYDELALFMKLKRHQPLWAGTFPIGVNVEGSDIDIVCNPVNLREFIRDTRKAYGKLENFKLTWKAIKQIPTVIVRFDCNGFLIELFAQPQSIEDQNAYIHMVVEARLLAIGGEEARSIIQKLKANGSKTEPAFAAYFNIESDDPYQALLDLAKLDDHELLEWVRI